MLAIKNDCPKSVSFSTPYSAHFVYVDVKSRRFIKWGASRLYMITRIRSLEAKGLNSIQSHIVMSQSDAGRWCVTFWLLKLMSFLGHRKPFILIPYLGLYASISVHFRHDGLIYHSPFRYIIHFRVPNFGSLDGSIGCHIQFNFVRYAYLLSWGSCYDNPVRIQLRNSFSHSHRILLCFHSGMHQWNTLSWNQVLLWCLVGFSHCVNVDLSSKTT